ncbi:MAG: ComEC/Rec2 family competence protein [Candidatus Krumholzibacteria bacterium]|nr:ComEC/Rec2 family competence protein [Candidatus Krumholzibacteria bacterium]
MFRALFLAELIVLWPACGLGILRGLALLIAFVPLPSRPGRTLPIFMLGILLALFSLRALPQMGEGEVKGRWLRSWKSRDGLFEGKVAGIEGVVFRGCGAETPFPGSPFHGKGRLLPLRAAGRKEFRLESWKAEQRESAVQRASRRGRLNRSRQLLFRASRHWPASTRPLARALLFGDRRALSRRQVSHFRDAGLAHLLALSGMHVAFFLLLLRRLFLSSGLGIARSEILLLFLLPFLPMLGGGGPSLRRASMMAGYLILGRRLGGRPPALEALCFAGFWEVLILPTTLHSAGFQLSYIATASLIVAAQAFRFRHGLPGRWLLEAMGISVLCNYATLPIALPLFHRLPLAGPLWNLLAAPLLGASLLSGWLFLPLSWLGMGETLVLIPSTLMSLLAGLARWGGEHWHWVLEGLNPVDWVWLPWALGMRLLWMARSHPANS